MGYAPGPGYVWTEGYLRSARLELGLGSRRLAASAAPRPRLGSAGMGARRQRLAIPQRILALKYGGFSKKKR